MIAPKQERGAALLTVLLLVAVMATIAATALDRIGVGSRLAINVANVGQARSWLNMAELLATTRIEDLLGEDETKPTLSTGWMGVERTIELPDGSTVKARVDDGGNCFNLNSLVRKRGDGTTVPRPEGASQFTTLMTLLGIAPGEATKIVGSTTDYLDSDSAPLPAGTEDGGQGGGGLSANGLMADPSELRAVPGVSERHFQLLERWVCALPTSDLSPINVNTLVPDQAPLVAMLLPGQVKLSRARAQIEARPAGGYSDVAKFWSSGALAGISPGAEVEQQLKLRTSFFTLSARVSSGEIDFEETALIDARAKPVRVVRREWGNAG
jgi:general secretion pathway protein K